MTAITLTRALVEIKTIDARITQAVNSTNFCFVVKGRGDRKAPHNVSMTLQHLSDIIVNSEKSLNDLASRRNTIKTKLIEANTTTKVIIAGKEYSIAGAIEAKRSMDLKKAILTNMRTQLTRCEQTIQVGNTKLNDEIEKAVADAFKGDKTKPTTEMYAAVANPRLDANELSLLDPVGLRAKIDDMEKNITMFLGEVDVALSEVNAKTTIEV